MNNALYNWLGECFTDLEEETGRTIDLAILQIDIPKDFSAASVVWPVDSNGDKFYEAYSVDDIPSKYITAVYDEYYEKIDVKNMACGVSR